MNAADLVIVVIVLVLASLAAFYSWKKRHSCADCPSAAGGSCSSSGSCCSSGYKKGQPSLAERYRKDHPKN